MNYHINDKKILILISIIIGIIFRIYGLDSKSLWWDEQYTFYLSDPKKNFSDFNSYTREFLTENIVIEQTPKIYYYLIRCIFIFFGYDPNVGKIFTIIISSLSILLVYYISKIILNNYYINLICCTLTSLNIFLIWNAQELRAQSIVLFLFLINFYFFLKTIKKFKKYFILNILSMVALLSFYPTTIIVVCAQIIFICLFYFSKKNLGVHFFSIIIYLSLNFEYIIKATEIHGNYATLYKEFFLGFFFNNFFGNVYLGAFHLILIGVLAIIFSSNKKFFLKHKLLFLNLIIISISYLAIVIYSTIKTGVARPHYIIFVLPCIIIFSIHTLYILLKINIKKKKIIFLTIILLNFINIFFTIDKPPIRKENLQLIIKEVINSEIKNVLFHPYVFDIKLMNNYFLNIKNIKTNKIKIVEVNNLLKYDSFWFICAANISTYIIAKDIKCDFIDKDENNKNLINFFYKHNVVSIDNFKLILYKKI